MEKKNPVLISPSDDKVISRNARLGSASKPIMGKTVTRREEVRPNLISKKMNSSSKRNDVSKKQVMDKFDNISSPNKIKPINSEIPVIKNVKDANEVVGANKVKFDDSSLFPKIDLDKKDSIFPEFTDIQRNNSFFDENEFNDLKDYIEDEKKGWF